MIEMTVDVGGMTCDHCTMAIERAVAQIGGVEGVKADLASGRVDVTFSDRPDEGAVRQAIEDEGYDVLAIAESPA